ncbi:beta-ketoacyl-ACP synthase III [Psychrobacter cryohalolentis]|uniref:3-oxoacyl-(Acyl-carrier protein) synthase n=1 Tax=Psychrobacter cryohalolentis (strain ATCC BAA-1226 / DSM 17306 / VKM B-2378 / K5) TaxID=335284 RepID=Q1QAW2_PSYCK|nr:beta-ketoacyl-ACP synthase III [Psychrobacter cryohalolentis]ABE75191.1 3-oxoacyl-(acyl-carrier protein) synthase [Psychrobacter cryohalolentis K5]ASE25388.1 beta-ketoacyl-ACP synthase III [Psychrobacter cryohalolentis]
MTTCITGTGLYIPPFSISNEELVESFNQYVEKYNTKHAADIEAGTLTALQPSSAAFIEKVSGIKSRYVMEKDGILNPDIMAPVIAYRNLGEELSIMAEMGVAALNDALADAGLEANDLDGIILACSNFQRTYPAVSIEIQNAIGMVGGFAYDMNVACSAATFGLSQAHGSIASGLAKRVAVVNVEITSAHLNWRNRDSHFIFGDVATACIVEELDTPKGYEILNSKLFTQFSTNIKNEYGFMDRSEFLAAQTEMYPDIKEPVTDKLFLQNGRKVFREVCPKVSEVITEHLQENNIATSDVKMMWLHQANANMLDLILRTVIGKEADKAIVPSVIAEFANTSSASPMIVFHRYKDDLASGDLGVICSFGAGYSIGSVIVRKV